MGLASAMSTALTGLSASETTIDVVGNNLANSNTVGFKASDVEFATQFLQTQSLGSAPTEGSGGNNPRQLGLGTMVAQITPDFNQGTIEISSNATDMAIQGDGFFIVQGQAGEQLYTRNGVFKLNSASELTTVTGNRVLGYGVDGDYNITTTSLEPIVIPLGAAAVAQATQNVYLEGTLSPTGNLSTKGSIIESPPLGDAAISYPDSTVAWSVLGAAKPAAVSAVDTAAGGTLADGIYSYRVVYVDAAGNELMFSEISASEQIQAADVNRTITMTLPPANGYTRRIYRNDGTVQNQWYFQANVAAAAGDAYTDNGSVAIDLNRQLDTQVMEGSQAEYYVTYVNQDGTKSRPSAVKGTGHSGRTVVTLPVPPSGEGWTAVALYRKVAGMSDAYLVEGNLPITGTQYVDKKTNSQIINPLNVLDFTGPRANDVDTLAVNAIRWNGTNYEKVFGDGGTFAFTGRKGGRALATKEMTINSTTSLASVVRFMSDSMGVQTPPGNDPNNPIPPDASGMPAGGDVIDGQITFVGNNGYGNRLSIDLSGMQMRSVGGTQTINLQFNTAQEAVGESAVTDFIAYDSLGISLPVRITAVLESRTSTATTYRWFADSSANVTATSNYDISVGSGLLRFDGDGNFISATQTRVEINREDVSARTPLTFNLDFAAMSGLAADKSTLAVSRQDGSAPGVLTSFIVGEDGRIRGVFSNGVTRDLGQIRLARFSNPAGLEQRGENMYAPGVNSGLPIEGDPGQQGIGKVVAGAVELSNTDIGANLIDLILASTMYRGNTRVITTAQQMLDELLALRR